MTPLRYWVVFGSAERQQRIEDRVNTGEFARARHHKCSGAVMQKTGIAQTQQRADDGVVFVAGAGDGVETLVAFLQFARGYVEQAARHLIGEDFARPLRGQLAAGA